MNHETNEFDDALEEEAQLTAYVLGELAEVDATAFSRRVETDETLRREIDAIRTTVAQVDDALAEEPAPGLTREQREAITAGAPHARGGVLFSFLSLRSVWAGAGLAAAACLAIAVLWPVWRSPRSQGTVAMQTPAAKEAAGLDEHTALRAGATDAGGETRSGKPESAGDASPALARRRGSTPGAVLRAELEPATGGARADDLLERAASPAPAEATARSAGFTEETTDGARERQAGAGGAGGGAALAERPERRSVAKKQRPPGSRAAPDTVFRAKPGDPAYDARFGGHADADLDADLRADASTIGRLAEESTEGRTGLRAGDGAAASPADANETYERLVDTGFHRPVEAPLSTFAIDVDTAAYANVMSFIANGQRPPKDAVRIEELINYFDYDYEAATGEHPLSVTTEVNTCPWNEAHRLVRIGLRGRDVESGAPVTIAKAVQIQVEFNPLRVGTYRLIGYADRLMTTPEPDDVPENAGEIDAGHGVTALYEIAPPGTDVASLAGPRNVADTGDRALRFQTPAALNDEAKSDEIMAIEVRYKTPEADTTTRISQIVVDDPRRPRAPSADFAFAAAVAGFGMELRDSPEKGAVDFDMILDLASEGAWVGVDDRAAAKQLVERFADHSAAGRRELAAAYARELMGMTLTDLQLVETINAEAPVRRRLDAALTQALADNEKGVDADVIERLRTRIVRGDAAVLDRRASIRAGRDEFVDMVERAREILGR